MPDIYRSAAGRDSKAGATPLKDPKNVAPQPIRYHNKKKRTVTKKKVCFSTFSAFSTLTTIAIAEHIRKALEIVRSSFYLLIRWWAVVFLLLLLFLFPSCRNSSSSRSSTGCLACGCRGLLGREFPLLFLIPFSFSVSGDERVWHIFLNISSMLLLYLPHQFRPPSADVLILKAAAASAVKRDDCIIYDDSG